MLLSGEVMIMVGGEGISSLGFTLLTCFRRLGVDFTNQRMVLIILIVSELIPLFISC